MDSGLRMSGSGMCGDVSWYCMDDNTGHSADFHREADKKYAIISTPLKIVG